MKDQTSRAWRALKLTRFLVLTGAMLASPETSRAGDAYLMDLQLSIEGRQTRFDAAHYFLVFPDIVSVHEGGAASDAVVTISSPLDRFSGDYEGGSNPQRSTHMPNTASVAAEIDGVWLVTLEDAGTTHEYDVEFGFDLPFAELPYFASTTLVNGSPVGRYDWTLEGGSVSYPGGELRVSLTTSGFATVDHDVLPGDAEGWTPRSTFPLAPGQFYASVATFNETPDPSSLVASSITPRTAGAPSFGFGALSVVYSASRQATLVGSLVPEPSSIILLSAAALATWRCGRRRSVAGGEVKNGRVHATSAGMMAMLVLMTCEVAIAADNVGLENPGMSSEWAAEIGAVLSAGAEPRLSTQDIEVTNLTSGSQSTAAFWELVLPGGPNTSPTADHASISAGRPGLILHQFTAADAEDTAEAFSWSNLVYQGGPSPPTNSPTIGADGRFAWQTTVTDALGVYRWSATVVDSGGSSDDGTLTVTLLVPEPSSIFLVGMAAIGLGLIRRPRRPGDAS